MPAHITHELFAREAFEWAFDSVAGDAIGLHRAYSIFGAQGPDFFLHNHRTRPSGLVFGKLLHSGGYGTFTRSLVETARKAGIAADSALGAFTLGFVTHAILDRKTHPFINFYSGWVERRDPGSVRFTNCHAFFERVIDVFVLELRAGTAIGDYDFRSRVDLGESLPEPILDAVVTGIESTYPEYRRERQNRRRVKNAYADTMGYYRFTNPPERDHLQLAWERDGGGIDPTRRLLALFHPDALPELDYLNGARATWNHPGDPLERHCESFIDLYEAALAEAAHPLRTTFAALSGEASLEAVEESIGNGNLSDGRSEKVRRRLEHISPLPLDEVLAVLYARIGSRITNR